MILEDKNKPLLISGLLRKCELCRRCIVMWTRRVVNHLALYSWTHWIFQGFITDHLLNVKWARAKFVVSFCVFNIKFTCWSKFVDWRWSELVLFWRIISSWCRDFNSSLNYVWSFSCSHSIWRFSVAKF